MFIDRIQSGDISMDLATELVGRGVFPSAFSSLRPRSLSVSLGRATAAARRIALLLVRILHTSSDHFQDLLDGGQLFDLFLFAQLVQRVGLQFLQHRQFAVRFPWTSGRRLSGLQFGQTLLLLDFLAHVVLEQE